MIWCSPGRESRGVRGDVVQGPGAPGTGQLPFAKPTRKLKRWLSVHAGTLGGRRAGRSQRREGAPGSREGLCRTNDGDRLGAPSHVRLVGFPQQCIPSSGAGATS